MPCCPPTFWAYAGVVFIFLGLRTLRGDTFTEDESGPADKPIHHYPSEPAGYGSKTKVARRHRRPPTSDTDVVVVEVLAAETTSAVWSPGEYLVIDWAQAAPGLFLFCAVLAFSRWRFVAFATDQRASTTLALIAEALGAIGGVPARVLADRMACLKGGVVANVVDTHSRICPAGKPLRFRPRFLPRRGPAIEGHRGEPLRLLPTRPCRAAAHRSRHRRDDG